MLHKMQLGSHQNVMRCCTGWCESPVASMPLPLLESGDLLCGGSVLQPRGGDGCWTMLIDAGHCNMQPQIMQNTQAARDPNKDTCRPLLETWPLQRTAEMDPCVDRWKHDRSRGQERSEIAMAVSCFNVDNFFQFFNAKWGGMIALICKHTHTHTYIYIYMILEYILTGKAPTCCVRFTDWGFAKRRGPGSTQHWITHGTPSRQIVHPTFASDCTIFAETNVSSTSFVLQIVLRLSV